jgi:hypothetical protein
MSGIDDPAPRRRADRSGNGERPGHRHGRARARSVPSDRATLAVRVPFVALLAVALAGAVTSDDPRADEQVGADRFDPAAVMPAGPPSGSGSSTWYCAAGTAAEGGMADHTVVIANPGDDDLQATLTVFAGDMVGAGAGGAHEPEPVAQTLDVTAGAQVSVRLAEVAESPLAAALVEVVGGPVSVEHRVSGAHGADVAPCSTAAAPRWHLAWGATTRDAREVVVIFNPFPSATTVDGVFTTEDGARAPVRLQGLPIPARGVVGIEVGDDVTRSEQVSATFEARSGHVVVDRLQQHDGSLGIEGLSLTPALPVASDTWLFADGEATAPAPPVPAAATADEAEVEEDVGEAVEEDVEDAETGREAAAEGGAGGGRSEQIVVYNPGDERAEVEVRVVSGDDQRMPPPFRLSITAHGTQVVDLGEHERIDRGVSHTVVVHATDGRPVVAERVTVDVPAPDDAEGSTGDDAGDRPGVVTVAPGSQLAATRWAVASLAPAELAAGRATLVVFNPDPERWVEVRLDPLADHASADGAGDAGEDDPATGDEAPDAGNGPSGPFAVPPGTRLAIDLDADRREVAIGAVVVDADGPVVVERVMRRDDGGRVVAGVGVPGSEGAVALDDGVGSLAAG